MAAVSVEPYPGHWMTKARKEWEKYCATEEDEGVFWSMMEAAKDSSHDMRDMVASYKPHELSQKAVADSFKMYKRMSKFSKKGGPM